MCLKRKKKKKKIKEQIHRKHQFIFELHNNIMMSIKNMFYRVADLIAEKEMTFKN